MIVENFFLLKCAMPFLPIPYTGKPAEQEDATLTIPYILQKTKPMHLKSENIQTSLPPLLNAGG
jgi:hypothetical protein